jgi:hypothetical protein
MKATWAMSEPQLARVFAEHFGFTGRPGGWIYSPAGNPIAHGWSAFGANLAQRGFIKVGQGVNWRRAGERPVVR